MADEERQALRSEIDKRFKPIFKEHEEEGIPLRVLRSKLKEQGATDHMPPGKVEMLLQRADADADGHLNYDEFVRLVTEEDRGLVDHTHLTRFQRMVRGAVSSVVPGSSYTEEGKKTVDDYLTHYNCKPPPLFMILISLAELGVFIYYAVELKDTKTPVTAHSGVPLNSPLIYTPQRRYEAWRFFSYMFIHGGYIHLIFNLIIQLLLGIPLEMVHKWWRVGIVYCLGVAAGSLCHSVFDMYTMLCGASGGCYALIGAHVAIVVMNWKEMTHEWMSGPIRFLSSAPVRICVWITLAAADVGLAIWNRYNNPDAGQNVGYAAHFGGALAGLLIGIPVLKNIHVKPWERILWWVSLIVYVLFIAFGVAWNVFNPLHPKQDWRPCCPYPLPIQIGD